MKELKKKNDQEQRTGNIILTTLYTEDQLHRLFVEHSNELFRFNIFERTRKREYVGERQALMYVLHQLTPLPLATIGRICSTPGGPKFDHATVLHSARIVRAQTYLSDRQAAVNRWMNFVLSIAAKNENGKARFYHLLDRVSKTLLLDETERETLVDLRALVVNS